MRCSSVAWVMCLWACGRFNFEPLGGGRETADSTTATSDSDSTLIDAVPLGPWGPPMLVSELSDAAEDDDPTATADLLEVVFESRRAGGDVDLFVSTRANVGASWSVPAEIIELNTVDIDASPSLSADGLTLYFSRGISGALEIFRTTRATRQSMWGTPQLVMELGVAGNDDLGACVAASDLEIVHYSGAMGNRELYRSTRSNPTAAWGTPVRITELSTTVDEVGPCFAGNDLELYYASGAILNRDMYVATRTAIGQPFGARVGIAVVQSSANDEDPWVSPDGRTMFFSSNRSGNYEIYEARR